MVPQQLDPFFFSQKLQPLDVQFPAGVNHSAVKVASVLLPLIYHQEQWCVLFTKRTETVMTHKGQISFPGGMAETADQNPCMTALRETEEELGIHKSSIKLVGRMDHFQTITNLIIFPFIGIVDWPLSLRISIEEVSKVILIPLEWLQNPEHSIEQEYNGHSNVVFYQPYEGEILWGITAGMTKKFLSLLEK